MVESNPLSCLKHLSFVSYDSNMVRRGCSSAWESASFATKRSSVRSRSAPQLSGWVRRVQENRPSSQEFRVKSNQCTDSRCTSDEVKSCATKRCSTPPGPEGSNGRQRVLCDTGKLDLFFYLSEFIVRSVQQRNGLPRPVQIQGVNKGGLKYQSCSLFSHI